MVTSLRRKRGSSRSAGGRPRQRKTPAPSRGGLATPNDALNDHLASRQVGLRHNPEKSVGSQALIWLLVIDLRALRDAPDVFRASQTARGADPATVDAVLEADERRRAAVTRAD